MYISGTTETSLKIVNPILEELATCLLLKLSPYHFKSDLEDVTDMHLTWHQEVELTNGEQTSTKTVYGVHKLFFSETMSNFKCIIHYWKLQTAPDFLSLIHGPLRSKSLAHLQLDTIKAETLKWDGQSISSCTWWLADTDLIASLVWNVIISRRFYLLEVRLWLLLFSPPMDSVDIRSHQ